jgi:hypothetical protein
MFEHLDRLTDEDRDLLRALHYPVVCSPRPPSVSSRETDSLADGRKVKGGRKVNKSTSADDRFSRAEEFWRNLTSE